MTKDNTRKEDDKKYILLQNRYSIAYNSNNCFVNGEVSEKVEGCAKKGKELAEEFKNNFYNSFFKRHYKNLIILTAAGTSLDNGIESGKTREGLWTYCLNEINAFKAKIDNLESKDFFIKRDIENLLSYIILYGKVNNKKEGDNYSSLRKVLEKKIALACKPSLDKNKAPHKDFLNKITARKPSDSRVQLFTTNYDTLFEQAANDAGFVIIDGFSFTQPRKFSGRYFDFDIVNREKTRVKQEESFITKVFHLYKLHGSLNWVKYENGKIEQKDEPEKPLIIYPASEKYESSYEQPYFEMMSRFQQALRTENSLLIVIGFGFQDKHIQNVIIEAVDQNPSFQLVIVNYNNKETIETTNLDAFFDDKENMTVKRNVTILFDKFSDFTNKYPDNQTYKEDNNESFQS